MRRILLLLAALALVTPALAQTAPPAAVTAPSVTLPQVPRISAAHAAALGAGMFAGAVAGSALIHGGTFAAAIGAVAGLGIGHWWWTEGRDAHD
jgi:hypothetical protein